MKRILLILLPFLPSITFAAAPTASYDLIAPIGTLSGSVTLSQYLEGIFQTVIGIAGVLAVLMLVICGIRLMGTGSVAGKSEAKQCIWNAIFGLLLAIGSWILLNTINPLLLKSDGTITVNSPAPITTPLPAKTNAPAATGGGYYYQYTDPSTGTTQNSPKFSSPQAAEAAKKASPGPVVKDTKGLEVKEAPSPSTPPPSGGEIGARNAICGNDSCVGNSSTNVYINARSCPSVGSTGCTNVDGLPSDTISFIQSLTSAGKITISGGTEYWLHKSHKAGKPIFDLRHTPALDKLVKETDPSSKRASFVDNEWLYNGYWFTNESSHWHVCKVGTNTTYCRPK